MEKLRWRMSDVIAYVESKILDNTATTEELEMYEDYKWTGKLDKINYIYTYKNIVAEMRIAYEGR